MSCQNADDPPYQGAIYLNFDVPGVMGTPKFFAAIAAAMRAEGWQEALPPNRHPGGHALTRDGVTIIYFRNDDTSTRGTMQIYGECRNVTDHRLDTTGWVDITPSCAREPLTCANIIRPGKLGSLVPGVPGLVSVSGTNGYR